MLEKRRLGRMNFAASIITLGGCGLGKIDQTKADEAIKLALQYGVNMVDVAPRYGDAELRLRPWMKKRRHHFFIAEKTTERTREAAWKELHNSLERLGVKTVDLYQLHQVGDLDELEIILQKNGALAAFREAKETGLINHIGITGHKNMKVIENAIEKFDFDSILLPVNLASMVNPTPENDFRPILHKAADRDIAVIAIKAIAKRRWRADEKTVTTWYKPVDTADEAQQAVRFTLSQEAVVTYSLPCDTRLWPMVLEAADTFHKLDTQQQTDSVAYARKAGFRPLFPTTVGEFAPE